MEYEDFDEPRASDRDLTSSMAKIAVAEDQALSKAYPEKSGCSIAVTLADGTTLQAARDYPKGDPADPLTDAEIEDKFRQYFFFAESSSEADAIINRLWTLDHQTSLDWLIAPLKRRVEAIAKAQQ